jgi:hypothetical protein
MKRLLFGATTLVLSSAAPTFKDHLLGSLKTENLPTMTEWLDAFELIPTVEGFNKALPQNRDQPLMSNMTCQDAIDNLYVNATNFDFGSIFYILLNGWYLGAWGDYGSCLADATYGQYVLVTIDGNYDTEHLALFTRGSIGKYKRFSTNVGLCMPYQCQELDMAEMSPKFVSMAENANWTDVTVSYRFSSRDDVKIHASGTGLGIQIITIFVLTLMGLGVAGTIVELTHIGDQPNLDYSRLAPASKFVSIKQYEPILIQRKKAWAQFALVFSALRNFMHLSKQPRAY